jgi:hypothetical protein
MRECYLGNPEIGAVDGIGGPDRWDNVIGGKPATKKRNKKETRKNKMSVDDLKLMDSLIRKYGKRHLSESLSEMENLAIDEYNGYDRNMIKSLIDDGFVENESIDIENFIDDYCMAFWASDSADLAQQYVDSFYDDSFGLIKFVVKFGCFDYEKFGRDVQIDLSDDEDEDGILEMSEYKAGKYMVDNIYGGLEETLSTYIRSVDKIKNYIDYEIAGEQLLMIMSYTSGVDVDGNNFYILIFD